MRFVENWKQRADTKEIAKIFEISKTAQKIWNESFTKANSRTLKIQGIFMTYNLQLADFDYQYIRCFGAYLEALKTETPLSRMHPDALALRTEIDILNREKFGAIAASDEDMRTVGKESAAAYISHVVSISQAAMEISRLSSVPKKPKEFFLATAVHANMLIQIRNGTITGVK